MNDIDLDAVRSAHFVGIGGIGVSAIARMLVTRGTRVTGSDRERSRITAALEKLGARISYGHAEGNLPDDADLVIYTAAADDSNPELARARALGMPAITYAESLGIVSRDKYVIAVSGTHGKTTTTAMIGKILADAGLDPTVVVGSLLKDTGSNLVMGGSDYFVVEACEYKRSFLSLRPHVLVITNIEEDHLDYYRDLADIQSAFSELAARVPEDGTIVCDPDDPALAPVLARASARIVGYGEIDAPPLRVPGEHNIKDARAALAVADTLGIDPDLAAASVAGFEGTWRRFERKGETPEGAVVIDDYAHHPTEVSATIAGAREAYPGKRVIAVFQPHLYSRTKEHLEEFAEALSKADETVVVPIYAAREAPDPSVTHSTLAERIGRSGGSALSAESLGDAFDLVRLKARAGDVVLVMGAGDVTKLAAELASPDRASQGKKI